jgi:hypothetical protein
VSIDQDQEIAACGSSYDEKKGDHWVIAFFRLRDID